MKQSRQKKHRGFSALMLALLCASLAGCGSAPKKSSRQIDGSSKLKTAEDNSPAMINVQLGAGYLQRGDLDVALEKLQRALEYDPRLAVAHSLLGVVYTRMGVMDKARKHYRLSVKYGSNDASIVNNYGTFLCQQGEYDEAVRYYDMASHNRFYQTPHIALENAGVCLMKAGKLDLAEARFKEALRWKPDSPVSLYNMVIIQDKKGKPFKVRAFLQRLEAVHELDDKMLAIGYRAEKQLGNPAAAQNYYQRLAQQYPKSPALKALQ